MSGSKILIVEDEFLIRLTLSEAISDEGFVVLEADNGEAALDLFKQDPDVGLLLTDMQLPGRLNGRSLAAALRELRPGLPVIFTSGRPDMQAQSPHELFIAKPYLPSDILASVRRMMAATQ